MIQTKIKVYWQNLDVRTRWLCALYGPWALGFLICLVNHYLFASLHNKDASRYNPTAVAALKNIWPIAVRACMVASATTAFVPILWSSLPNKPIAVGIIDSALQLPAFTPALRIAFSGSLKGLLVPVLATLNVLSYAAVTIVAPAALVLRPPEYMRSSLRVPVVDFSIQPTRLAVIDQNGRYVRPDAHLLLDMQEMVRLNNFVPWDAPLGCTVGCVYNITYRSPVLKCKEYLPKSPYVDPVSQSQPVYSAQLLLTDSYPVFDMAVWPSLGTGTDPLAEPSYNITPTGARCTFHQGNITSRVYFRGTDHQASILAWAILEEDPLPGAYTEPLDPSSCPWNSSSIDGDPLTIPACASARGSLNTWAFVDAFSRVLTGTVSSSSQSTGFGTKPENSMILSNLYGIFTYNEQTSKFVYDPSMLTDRPWLILGSALERMFARSTLALTLYAGSEGRTSVVEDAKTLLASRYVYTPRTLWLAYAGALVTVIIPGLLACYSIWRGFVLTDETTLAKVLVTTRDNSLNIIKGMSVDQVDGLVLRYGPTRAGSDWEDGMGFTVVLAGEDERSQKTMEERIGLLHTV